MPPGRSGSLPCPHGPARTGPAAAPGLGSGVTSLAVGALPSFEGFAINFHNKPKASRAFNLPASRRCGCPPRLLCPGFIGEALIRTALLCVCLSAATARELPVIHLNFHGRRAGKGTVQQVKTPGMFA